MRPVYGDYNLYKKKKPIFGNDIAATLDVAIPVLHGSNVEDGIFEGVLQSTGIPYAGCDVLASANGMDKITMKMILRSEGIPVVDYVWFTDGQWATDKEEVVNRIEATLGYPVIVKPANLGSSVGIGRAKDRESLIEKINEAQRYSARIIVEHMVDNLQEINCSVLGDCDDNQASVTEEVMKTGDILSYTDKYAGGSKGAKGMQASSKQIPANLSKEETDKIQYLARETFRVLGCHGVSRIDFIIDRDTRAIYVNEINTIPGSLSFYLWEATGLTFDKLMERLVALALKRKRAQERKTFSFDANIFALGPGLKGGIKK